MKKQRVRRDIPVSQRELAKYLGISASMMNMSSGSTYAAHRLASPLSIKLAGLSTAHQEVKKSRSAGTSVRKLQDDLNSTAAKFIDTLEPEAAHAEGKARLLKEKLDEMLRREQEDRQWLNTVDHLLANLARTKEQQADRKWLENQQAVVYERLRKNNRKALVKLEIQAELEKARAVIIRAILKKQKASQP